MVTDVSQNRNPSPSRHSRSRSRRRWFVAVPKATQTQLSGTRCVIRQSLIAFILMLSSRSLDELHPLTIPLLLLTSPPPAPPPLLSEDDGIGGIVIIFDDNCDDWCEGGLPIPARDVN